MSQESSQILEKIDALSPEILQIVSHSPGPEGSLPLDAEMLRNSPSGNVFGLTQNAGMGWDPALLSGRQFLILSTQGGLRSDDGTPIALGYHTGHWELGLLVREAAVRFKELGCIPFSGQCSDPCDGRSQGTTGMFDSLAYRNDAAIVLRRLIRSLPTARGVLGIATCDKGLPAMMMALAGAHNKPSVLVPGGVTLPPTEGEDAGKVQSIGARFAHGEITLQEAAELGCRACGSAGGGCQFLGTAATSQVVAEALGLTLPHAALAPSGQPIWLALARHSAEALLQLEAQRLSIKDILTADSLHNAMTIHAAFGGSTNLLLHIPAIAFAAGLKRPTVSDWQAVNAQTPRLVDVLPNGPVGHSTVQVFMAGGVLEVMLHLRGLGLLKLGARSVTGMTVGDTLEWWEKSTRREVLRRLLRDRDGVDPDRVIMSPDQAKANGLTSTVTFPCGNLAPEGSVIKSTAIDPSVVGADGVYRKTGPARVFCTEREAIAAIKSESEDRIRSGDIIVLICAGPLGSGMEETYQVTSALKHLSFGKEIALISDARFSGVSTGACIGHVGPEALAGGPIGKIRSGDIIRIEVDCRRLVGSVDLVGEAGNEYGVDEGTRVLESRSCRNDLASHPELPDDTRLWAALQQVGGGTWGGCVFDVDLIVNRLSNS